MRPPPEAPRRRRPAVIASVAGLLGLGALGACGAAALPHPAGPTSARDGGVGDASAEGGPGDAAAEPAIVDAAALGATLAPGMRLVERTKLDVDGGTYALAPSDADRCYRVAILAPALVDATLTDDAGHVLATARGTNPALGARGPVCLRRGRRATVAITSIAGATTPVELIVWSAP